MPILTIGPLALAYEVQGEGEPVVLLAGLASDRRSWAGFDRLLARAMRVISFDNRGVGGTTGPISPYSIGVLADDTIRLLDGLSIEKCHVLGVSMGGMAALDLAIRHPDRLLSLALGCTHPGGKMQVLPRQEIIDKLPSLGKSAEQMAADFLSVTHSPRYLTSDPERYGERLRDQIVRGVPRRVYLAQLGAILAHDVSLGVGTIKAPTLVITGDEDELVPLANAMVLAERIPTAKLVVLGGIAHAFWIESPERAALEVLRFFTGRSLPPPASP